MTEDHEKKWEEPYKEVFYSGFRDFNDIDVKYEDVRDFIREQLSLAKQEGRDEAATYIQYQLDEPEQTKSRYQIIQEARNPNHS